MPSIAFWEYVGGGTARYRCRTPGGALARLGWDVSYVEDFDSPLDADVLVLQRVIADWVPETIRALKSASPDTLVVYDMDDWFDDIPEYNPASNFIAQPESSLAYLHETMELTDLITVTTPGLADLYGRFAPTAVLPNYLDPEIWETPAKNRHGLDTLNIGWLAAYKWRGGDLEVLRSWLQQFLEDHPEVRFGALGCPELLSDIGIAGFSTEMAAYEFLPDMLGPIDIGLVPLTFNTFNWRGKSWCKSLEYNAMGIPAIASPSEANRAYIQPGVNGYLVRKNEWVKTIERAIDNLDALRAGSRRVAEGYFIDLHVSEWVDAYATARRSRGDLRSRRAVSAAVS